MQYISQRGTFKLDSVQLRENLSKEILYDSHFNYEVSFAFEGSSKLGYPFDSIMLESILMQWFDLNMHRKMFMNPHDKQHNPTDKIKFMSLNGFEWCNPSIENICREVFLSLQFVFENYKSLQLHKVRLYTENELFFTDCFSSSIPNEERLNFMHHNYDELMKFAQDNYLISL